MFFISILLNYYIIDLIRE